MSFLPRVCSQSDRAPAGMKRFKIRCTNYGDAASPSAKYILARTEGEARQCFLRIAGIADPSPELSVQVLAD